MAAAFFRHYRKYLHDTGMTVPQKLQLITATYAPYILDNHPPRISATKNFQLAIKRSSLELSPPHSRRSTENPPRGQPLLELFRTDALSINLSYLRSFTSSSLVHVVTGHLLSLHRLRHICHRARTSNTDRDADPSGAR